MKKLLFTLIVSIGLAFTSISFAISIEDFTLPQRLLIHQIEMKIDRLTFAQKNLFRQKVMGRLDRASSNSLTSRLLIYLLEYSNTVRSVEARELEKNSEGKIVLRDNGKIDFPTIGLYGTQRLYSDEPTDFTGGIVRADYVDQHGKTGVKGLTYMSGKKAMLVAEKQGLKLLSRKIATETEKIEQLVDILGIPGKMKTLHILFGSDFMGHRDGVNNMWSDLTTSSFIALSEVDENGNAYGAGWYIGDVVWTFANPANQTFPYPFLAFERIE